MYSQPNIPEPGMCTHNFLGSLLIISRIYTVGGKIHKHRQCKLKTAV